MDPGEGTPKPGMPGTPQTRPAAGTGRTVPAGMRPASVRGARPSLPRSAMNPQSARPTTQSVGGGPPGFSASGTRMASAQTASPLVPGRGLPQAGQSGPHTPVAIRPGPQSLVAPSSRPLLRPLRVPTGVQGPVVQGGARVPTSPMVAGTQRPPQMPFQQNAPPNRPTTSAQPSLAGQRPAGAWGSSMSPQVSTSVAGAPQPAVPQLPVQSAGVQVQPSQCHPHQQPQQGAPVRVAVGMQGSRIQPGMPARRPVPVVAGGAGGQAAPVRPSTGPAGPTMRAPAAMAARVIRPGAESAAGAMRAPARSAVPAPRPAAGQSSAGVQPVAATGNVSVQSSVAPRRADVPSKATTEASPTPPTAASTPAPTLPTPTPAPAPTVELESRERTSEVPVATESVPSSKKVSTTALNLDDVKETYLQLFGADPPAVSQRAVPGSEGTPCSVTVNLFPVTLPRGNVYHYDVEISAAGRKTEEQQSMATVPTQIRARCASTLVNRQVIDAFARCYRNELQNSFLAFDGRRNIYTRKMLQFTEHLFTDIEAEINGEKCFFFVHLRYAATVSFDKLHGMYDNDLRGAEQFQDAIQAADVILRTGPTLRFVPVGRSFFSSSTRPVDLGGCREAWFGFYSSIRLGSWKPLVNIDMSATAFYVSMPLIDFVVATLNKSDVQGLRAGLNDRDRIMLNRELRTLKVTMNHLKSSRQYRIEALSRNSASTESFEYEGQNITVAQYFANRHKIKLKFPNLPCIHVGKRNTFVPMEVCTVAPGQHCRKKLSEIQTRNMIKQTALSPSVRFDRIKRSVAELKQSSAQFCKEFDMVLETQPLQIEARILKSPVITHGGDRKQPARNGEWKCDAFLKPAAITQWALAILGRISPEKTKQIIDLFQREGSKLGMKIPQPVFVFKYGPQVSPRAVLEDVKTRYPAIEITVVVLDRNSDYGALKAEAETTDLCMRTQCVLDFKVETKFNPVFAVNLLQKINTKMGGRNNGATMTGLPNTLLKPFMAIGIDVNHPGPGDSTPSIAVIVASMDPVPSQYYACTSVQTNSKGSRSEYVVETESMFAECLTEFKKRNKVLPQHIYIFRDGVSEGQFDAVRIYELGAIRKACLQVRDDYTPKMTFIVVQKRHHVRFMPAGGDRGYGKSGNVHSGTIVDSKIINPGIFDFYLCSQQGLQGTSRPAHYHVVHDDANHTQDEIYKICFKFCHTYARCSRTVSIPAPAYYAHLAAFRAKEHIKGRVYHGAGYAESNSGSVRSSSSSEPDLDRFQAAQKVLSQMRGSMYFV